MPVSGPDGSAAAPGTQLPCAAQGVRVSRISAWTSCGFVGENPPVASCFLSSL